MKNIHIGFQLVPLVSGKDAWPIIDLFIGHIKNSGKRYEVTPLETIVECTFEEAITLVKSCYTIMEKEFHGEYLLYFRAHVNTKNSVNWNEKTQNRKT